MESWVVGYGEGDVERHVGIEAGGSAPPPIRLRVVSDYI
ncbi:hypothetical protein LCGC14_2319710 [marine sediment metagenome]|uniref:Uncharacterized protein n=1 Tax=marine sediment metagenome TaxID=412755 RepID=A0A0F9CIR4_9ZZZZ